MSKSKCPKEFMENIEYGSVTSPAWMIKIIIFEEFIKKVKAKESRERE